MKNPISKMPMSRSAALSLHHGASLPGSVDTLDHRHQGPLPHAGYLS